MYNNFFKFFTYGKCLAPIIWDIKQHPYTNRLYYVYGGSAFFLNHGIEYKLRENNIYFFPYNIGFKIRQDKDDRLNHMYFDFMAVPPVISDRFFEYNVMENTEIYHALKAIDLIMDNLYEKKTGKRVVHIDDVDSWYNNTIMYFFKGLFALLCNELKIEPIINGQLNKVLEYIYNNYKDNISVETLASIAGLNTSYFIRIFKKTMKMTPHQFLKMHRLNVALTMLNRDMSIQEIAESIGFENASSLTHALKKNMGVSPTQYRKKFL